MEAWAGSKMGIFYDQDFHGEDLRSALKEEYCPLFTYFNQP